MSSIVAIFVFQSYSDPDSNEPNHIAIRYTHHVGTEDGAAQQIASKLACANEERLPIATSWDACIVDAVSVETLPPSAQACVERVLINNETSDAYLVRRLRDASARSEFRKAQLVGTREMFSDLRREVLNIKSQRIKTIDRDVQRAKKKLTKLNVILRYEVVNRLIKAINHDNLNRQSSADLTALEHAGLGWILDLVDWVANKSSRNEVAQETEVIATRVVQDITPDVLALLCYCRQANFDLGQVRYVEQHPSPTFQFAIKVVTELSFNSEYREAFGDLDAHQAEQYLVHLTESATRTLFLEDDDDDELSELEDLVATLQAERATYVET